MRISVIIPNWNGASFLEKAIQSALHQGELVGEVLVCDDGSTDQSAEIVASISDSRVKWLPGAHQGLPAIPRNRGIRAAQEELIAFLDNDDVWLPGKLEAQLRELLKPEIRLVSTNAWRMVNGGRQGKVLSRETSGLLSFTHLARCNEIICSSVLTRKSDLLKSGLFSESPRFRAVEDYQLWLRMTELGSMAYLASPYVEYRDQPTLSLRGKDTQAAQRLSWVYRDYAFSRLFKVDQWSKIAVLMSVLAWRKLKDLCP